MSLEPPSSDNIRMIIMETVEHALCRLRVDDIGQQVICIATQESTYPLVEVFGFKRVVFRRKL